MPSLISEIEQCKVWSKSCSFCKLCALMRFTVSLGVSDSWINKLIHCLGFLGSTGQIEYGILLRTFVNFFFMIALSGGMIVPFSLNYIKLVYSTFVLALVKKKKKICICLRYLETTRSKAYVAGEDD